MPKRFPRETEQIAGELYFSGLEAREITERLNNGEAGYPHPIPISERSVRDKLRDYEIAHGPRPIRDELNNLERVRDSYERRCCQAMARLEREIGYYDKRRSGSLTVPDMQRLGAAQSYLSRMLARTEQTQRSLKPRGGRSQTTSGKDKPESVVERIARQAREGAASGPSTPDPIPSHTPEEKGNATGNGASGADGSGIEGSKRPEVSAQSKPEPRISASSSPVPEPSTDAARDARISALRLAEPKV